MFEGRLTSRRLRARAGRGVLIGAAGLAVLGAGAWSAPAVPVLAGAIQNQPIHLLTHASGRSASTIAANDSCWQSSNWSGYAVSTTAAMSCVPASGASAYTSVSATWTVPTVTASSGGGLLGGLLGGGNTYSAVWTGIGGFNTGDTTLIQAGTEEDVTGGTPTYYAWWETLPQSEQQISTMTVHPGDSMTVTISNTGGNNWTITITDNGSGQTFSTPVTYSSSESSAEWIVEAPLVNGQQSTLAHYGSTVFDHGSVNGSAVTLKAGTGGAMAQGGILGIGGTVVSVPSDPDGVAPEGDGFACAYGSSQPAAPSS